jgi:hypothetical protein
MWDSEESRVKFGRVKLAEWVASNPEEQQAQQHHMTREMAPISIEELGGSYLGWLLAVDRRIS